jgi:nucleoside-diphosphate-sugar epimerase
VASPFALVTGATGFIGGRLVSHLAGQGWTVRACGRRPRPDDLPADADYRAVDLAADDDLAGLYEGVTHLFHLAGASSSKSDEAEMERSNVVGTRNLLAAAPSAQLERVVHMSSTSVYGEEEQLPLPVREDVQPRPSRGYGKAKWRAEQEVQEAGRSGLPTVVLRPVSVYGPGNTKLLASAILDVAIEAFDGATSVPVPAEPIEQRLVHLDDLLRACVHVAHSDEVVGRAFNVAGERYPSSHEVAGIVASNFDVEIDLAEDPEAGPGHDHRQAVHATMVERGLQPHILLSKERFRFLRKANRNNRLSVDALLATGFAFGHTNLEADIADTIAWYREHRWVI